MVSRDGLGVVNRREEVDEGVDSPEREHDCDNDGDVITESDGCFIEGDGVLITAKAANDLDVAITTKEVGDEKDESGVAKVADVAITAKDVGSGEGEGKLGNEVEADSTAKEVDVIVIANDVDVDVDGIGEVGTDEVGEVGTDEVGEVGTDEVGEIGEVREVVTFKEMLGTVDRMGDSHRRKLQQYIYLLFFIRERDFYPIKLTK